MTNILFVRGIACINYSGPMWPFADRVWRSEAVGEDTYPSLRQPWQQLRQADQVERGAREDEQPIDVRQATELHFADPRDRLQPAERRLDARAGMLTLRVARMPRRAGVDRTAARAREILCHVWRRPQLARQVNKLPDVIRLVGPHRATAIGSPLPLRVQHQHARVALRRPTPL